MSVQANARPIIIKKKKVSGGDGHHGGAWKVAYADFVTAMMAFFMLMWLLNATTEKQRKGIADYFSPTIPINRISGGGDGAFGGDSVFSEVTLPQNGTGASSQRPTEAKQARGEIGGQDGDDPSAEQNEVFESLEAKLLGKGGETKVMDNELQHIVTRLTDEGLVIELFALEDTPLFEDETDIPTSLLRDLARLIVEAARTVENDIAVEGHVQAEPIVLADRAAWKMSVARADAMRKLLKQTGVATERVTRITGHADREAAVKNPMAVRNNRIEVIFLRE
ncbi:chemotaxis protein MotB [Tateyamaria omphalii]|uniref:flagellar motor protein MotB n=1 Tax=Tateyamaria omphalii TaxID=299262 RepID=UPI001C9A04ED|nr:flagellar motor protein MotB [Tateyamaria omphalii]MBY5933645.1 chemotaxis protein MotB [Tateyamaria omphalii]